MEIENLDLDRAKKIIIDWAKEKPFITKIYLFGSRVTGISKKTGKTVSADSDLDVAIEFEKISTDENCLTTWTADSKTWHKELLGLLGFSKDEHLDLERYDPNETPHMDQYLKDSSILLYSSTSENK